MRALLLSLALVIAAPSVTAMDLSGPARILDGDTLEVANQRVRLHGIDAPETGQRCNGIACGEGALKAIATLVTSPVTCSGNEIDTYGRLIARCRVGGTDLGAAMVRSGWAAAYRHYSADYVAEEADARTAGRGMWAAGTPQMPWEYRRARWQVAAQTAPRADCPIKGNISGNGRIYHTPWSRWYDRTRIDTSRGERWFCDEAEALAAGWRAPHG